MAHETRNNSFTFPAEHGFPPFFTLQPNIQTAETQVEMWSRLVLAYCEHRSQFWLNAVGSWERTSALFCNSTIDRALSPAMIRLILAHLVKQDHAIYHPPLPKGIKPPEYTSLLASRETRAQSSSSASRPALSNEESACNQVLVLWKSPEEWGDAVYAWVCDTGQNQSIMTLHEIMTGTFVERSGMPPLLLRIALRTQVRKDRAQIFSVTTDRWSSLRGAGDLLAQATDESMLDLGVKFV
ncbi:hypothetical protein MPSI1_003071 [Malassezia psittaci]|uniref:Vacuolar protein-sorting-associated protein 25 n=1 Tax=Malassezia psittaci TaxID=1821823 RepID=A0AAF0F827_9BASI|nr:hypothetical protein MPSI1_003071 [Malassezia psittaci]